MIPFARLVLVTLAFVLFTAPAWAELKTEVSARKVGVGQSLTVQLTYVVDEEVGEPGKPQLKVGGQAEVRGPSVSTQRRVMMHNFSFQSEKSVVARYEVIPTKVGRLIVGPGSFQVGGRTVAGETIEVEVVEQAQGTGRGQRRRDPFSLDPFGGFGQDSDPFDDFFRNQRRRVSVPEAPEEYLVDKAPDEIAFLVARVNRSTVVVGEPVRLLILAYGARGDFGEQAPKESTTPEFLSYRVLDNPQAEPAYQTTIGGTTYVVRKLREYVVIPLKTGRLPLGAMSNVLQNGRRTYPQKDSQIGYSVSTDGTFVDVVEPPTTGRPPYYLLGDVGRYRLEAQLSQREIAQGEFAELVVQIHGEGQIPSRLVLPEQKGVTWESPAIKGGPEVLDGVLKGTRTLKYPVQFRETGEFDLGFAELPYFDPVSRRYVTARASLGKVKVEKRDDDVVASPGVAQDSDQTESQTADERFVPLEPRSRALDGAQATPIQAPAFAWWLIGGLPLVSYGGWRSAVGIFRLARREKSNRVSWKKMLSMAEAHSKNGDVARALYLAEKAIFETLEAALGLKGRGVLRAELAGAIEARGGSRVIAEGVVEALNAAEAARFASLDQDITSLLRDVEGLCRQISIKKIRKALPTSSSERSRL